MIIGNKNPNGAGQDPAKVKAQKHRHYLKHKEYIKKKAVEWAKANPDGRRAISKRDNDKRSGLKKQWWQMARFGVLIDMEECRRCGSESMLVVHHSDGNNGRMGKPLNNELDNLVVLCRSCHAKVHAHGVVKEIVC